MTVQGIRDRVLRTQIDLMSRAATVKDEMLTAVKRFARGERGQTPTEYLMIVGFMAVVIVVVFLIWYWNNVKQAAKDWSNNVQNAIKGGKVTP